MKTERLTMKYQSRTVGRLSLTPDNRLCAFEYDAGLDPFHRGIQWRACHFCQFHVTSRLWRLPCCRHKGKDSSYPLPGIIRASAGESNHSYFWSSMTLPPKPLSPTIPHRRLLVRRGVGETPTLLFTKSGQWTCHCNLIQKKTSFYAESILISNEIF